MDAAAEVNSERRILFASKPSWGHINLLISIAGELAAHGIGDIWFASRDERKAEIEAISGGESVRFASLGPSKPELEPENWPDETMRAMAAGSPLRNPATVVDVNTDPGYIRQQYLRTLDVVDEVPPALAVIDLDSRWAIDAVTRKGGGRQRHPRGLHFGFKRPLVELGVDSVMTVALRVRLQCRFGLDLPPPILWSKPTVAALGTHVAECFAQSLEAPATGEPGEEERRA